MSQTPKTRNKRLLVNEQDHETNEIASLPATKQSRENENVFHSSPSAKLEADAIIELGHGHPPDDSEGATFTTKTPKDEQLEEEDVEDEDEEEEEDTKDVSMEQADILDPGSLGFPPDKSYTDRRNTSSYHTIKLDPQDPKHFNEYLFALISFKADNGNYSVHKEQCPNLYLWLAYIKREYTRHTHQPSSSSLTQEQRRVLEFLHVPLTHRGDDHWNRFFGMLEAFKERHGHVLVPRICEIPGLGDWVTDQRRQYKAWKLGKANQLTNDRRERLEKLGFTWQVRYRPEWDQRFSELIDYKKTKGDCKVPQHYRENRALGKWVAKQREQWKLKQKGQHSFLTPDREEKLNQVGFVWQIRSGTEDDLQTNTPEPQEETQTPVAHVDV